MKKNVATELVSTLNVDEVWGEVTVICMVSAAKVTHHCSGGSKTISLRRGGDKVKFFKELSELEFDSSNLDEYVTGTVWLTDGTWLEMGENEVTGEGIWIHMTPPRLPNDLSANVEPQIEMVQKKLVHHTRVAEVAFRAYAHGYTRGCARNKIIDPNTPVDRMAAMLSEKLGNLSQILVHPDWYGVGCMEKVHTELITLWAALPTRSAWETETGRKLTNSRLPQSLATITWDLRTLINLMKVA
jgi:hypothetical protein